MTCVSVSAIPEYCWLLSLSSSFLILICIGFEIIPSLCVPLGNNERCCTFTKHLLFLFFQIGWILNSVHREEEGTFDGLIWTTTNHSLVVVFFLVSGFGNISSDIGKKINPYSLKQINGYPYISPLNTTHVLPLKGEKTRPYSGLQGIRHVCRVNKQKKNLLIIKLFLEASLGIYHISNVLHVKKNKWDHLSRTKQRVFGTIVCPYLEVCVWGVPEGFISIELSCGQ